MQLDLLSALMAARAARRPAILVTDIGTGAQRLVTPDTLNGDPLEAELGTAFRTGKSGMAGEGDDARFLTVEVPPPRLLVIGAVHISQALAPLARIAGYDMVVVDPRTAFATPERFPDVEVIAEWPDAAIPRLGIDPFTALVALTHDPKIDEPALIAGLGAGCFYVGALGSRRTHAKRLERLHAAGVSPEATARIHAPIGLPIGAVSPGEIAVAILAEIIGALRTAPAGREAAA